MGMSSSQARLLNLTSRMHQIEYKAAKLEAQKLQMANESAHVYNDYLNALESNKIQFKTLNRDGSVTYKDATLASLQHSLIHDTSILTSAKAFLVQDTDKNELYLTESVANAFGLSNNFPTKEEYLDTRVPKYKEMVEVDDYTNIRTVTPAENGQPSVGTHPVTTYSYSMNPSQIAAIPTPDTTRSVAAYTSYNENVSSYEPWVQITTDLTPATSSGSFVRKVTSKETVPAGYTAITNASQLAGISGDGKYILMNDIDLSGVNWTSISNFSGKFDGNGHKIMGLNKALFNNLSSSPSGSAADISNLEISVTNFTDTAILAKSTGSAFYYMTNLHITGTISGNNSSCAGLVDNFSGAVSITNTYIDLRATGNKNINAVCSSGSIQIYPNNSYVHLTGSGTNSIYGSATMTNVTGTDIIMGTTDVTNGLIKGTISIPNNESIKNYLKYLAYDENNHNDSPDNYTLKVDGNPSLTSYQLASILYYVSNSDGDESQKQNVINAIKAGNDLDTWANKFTPSEWNLNQESKYNYSYSSENHSAVNIVDAANRDDIVNSLAYGVYQYQLSNNMITNETKIDSIKNAINAFTNNQLVSLSADPSKRNTIITALATNNCSITAVQNAGVNTNLYSGYTISFDQTPVAPLTETVTEIQVDNESGTLEIPQTSEIASNLVVAFRKIEKEIDNPSQVTTNLNGKSLDYLADLNDYVVKYLNGQNDGSKIEALYNYIMNNGSSVSLPACCNHSTYTTTQTSKGNCQVSYNPKEVWTGRMLMDTSSPEYARYSKEYDDLVELRGTDCKIKIVDEDLANSTEFLSNLLVNNSFILLDASEGITKNMFKTSVSTDTNLQEVNNEVELKKAEAKYEADMKRIDMKDRKYDTDLAALDAERNALKQEMETLKTVAKDNVDRTFKLFS